jgi:hypothetical protein
MKIVFLICAQPYTPTFPVMDLLARIGIDFYTRWDKVTGKGHGSMAHLGTPSFPAENAVLMIAFEDERLLPQLIEGVVQLNKGAVRAEERVRLFQLPLDRVV